MHKKRKRKMKDIHCKRYKAVEYLSALKDIVQLQV